MPTYDYHCDACEHEFELFQSINDPHEKKCPKCGKLKLRRLFGAGAAIVFKGSGFYQTDYRSDNYKKQAKADKDSSSGGSKDSGSKETGAKDSGSKNSSPKDSGAKESGSKSSDKKSKGSSKD